MARSGGSLGPFNFSFTGLLAFVFLGVVTMVLGSVFHQPVVFATGEAIAFIGVWVYLLRFMRMPPMIRMAAIMIGVFVILAVLIW